MAIETNQRLTNDIRESIVNDLMKHRFSGDVKALCEEFAAFAAEIYDIVYTADFRKKIAALPSGFLPESMRICVQFGGGYSFASIEFNGSQTGDLALIYRPAEAVLKRVSYRNYNGCAKNFEATAPEAIKYDALKNKLTDLQQKISEAKLVAKRAVASVTTVKRLCEIWPEVAPFCKKFGGAKPQLPALPVERLNTILDLPVSESA